MKYDSSDFMNELKAVSLKPGQAVTVNVGPKVQIELRLTPKGQPEIFCDHRIILRPFEDWYQPNETC